MLPEALAKATIPPPVSAVLQTLSRAGYRAFLVGGCVRDLLRGQPPKDFDIATSATPSQVQQCFRRVIPTGIAHGTVTVVVGAEHVEVTTFRTEGDYVDGRRPSSVEFQTDIAMDLGRRDFTINAMAFDPVAGELVDPFDGQLDLDRRLIRCVRSAMARFTEDGLRPLRAVRFAAVLGFDLEPETEAAIAPTLSVFRRVALERVNQEFVKTLSAQGVARGLALLDRTGLLSAFLPEAAGADLDAVTRAPHELTVQLAVLLVRAGGPREICLRLKFPNAVADEVAHLIRHRTLPADDASDAELRRWLAAVDVRFALKVLQTNAAHKVDVGVMLARIPSIMATRPPLNAKALALDGAGIMRTLGVPPGPIVGDATRHLLELVLDRPELNTVAGLTAALQLFSTGSPQDKAAS